MEKGEEWQAAVQNGDESTDDEVGEAEPNEVAPSRIPKDLLMFKERKRKSVMVEETFYNNPLRAIGFDDNAPFLAKISACEGQKMTAAHLNVLQMELEDILKRVKCRQGRIQAEIQQLSEVSSLKSYLVHGNAKLLEPVAPPPKRIRSTSDRKRDRLRHLPELTPVELTGFTSCDQDFTKVLEKNEDLVKKPTMEQEKETVGLENQKNIAPERRELEKERTGELLKLKFGQATRGASAGGAGKGVTNGSEKNPSIGLEKETGSAKEVPIAVEKREMFGRETKKLAGLEKRRPVGLGMNYKDDLDDDLECVVDRCCISPKDWARLQEVPQYSIPPESIEFLEEMKMENECSVLLAKLCVPDSWTRYGFNVVREGAPDYAGLTEKEKELAEYMGMSPDDYRRVVKANLHWRYPMLLYWDSYRSVPVLGQSKAVQNGEAGKGGPNQVVEVSVDEERESELEFDGWEDGDGSESTCGADEPSILSPRPFSAPGYSLPSESSHFRRRSASASPSFRQWTPGFLGDFGQKGSSSPDEVLPSYSPSSDEEDAAGDRGSSSSQVGARHASSLDVKSTLRAGPVLRARKARHQDPTAPRSESPAFLRPNGDAKQNCRALSEPPFQPEGPEVHPDGIAREESAKTAPKRKLRSSSKANLPGGIQSALRQRLAGSWGRVGKSASPGFRLEETPSPFSEDFSSSADGSSMSSSPVYWTFQKSKSTSPVGKRRRSRLVDRWGTLETLSDGYEPCSDISEDEDADDKFGFGGFRPDSVGNWASVVRGYAGAFGRYRDREVKGGKQGDPHDNNQQGAKNDHPDPENPVRRSAAYWEAHLPLAIREGVDVWKKAGYPEVENAKGRKLLATKLMALHYTNKRVIEHLEGKVSLQIEQERIFQLLPAIESAIKAGLAKIRSLSSKLGVSESLDLAASSDSDDSASNTNETDEDTDGSDLQSSDAESDEDGSTGSDTGDSSSASDESEDDSKEAATGVSEEAPGNSSSQDLQLNEVQNVDLDFFVENSECGDENVIPEHVVWAEVEKVYGTTWDELPPVMKSEVQEESDVDSSSEYDSEQDEPMQEADEKKTVRVKGNSRLQAKQTNETKEESYHESDDDEIESEETGVQEVIDIRKLLRKMKTMVKELLEEREELLKGLYGFYTRAEELDSLPFPHLVPDSMYFVKGDPDDEDSDDGCESDADERE